jgi:hypothetical protein
MMTAKTYFSFRQKSEIKCASPGTRPVIIYRSEPCYGGSRNEFGGNYDNG